MERPFSYPLTMKNGKVYDAYGKDVTEKYETYKNIEHANKMVEAVEKLYEAKQVGIELETMLYIDSSYKFSAVVKTFEGDNLTDRLGLSLAGDVYRDGEGRLAIRKMFRKLVPFSSLADLYKIAALGDITIQQAELAWDNREAFCYLIQ